MLQVAKLVPVHFPQMVMAVFAYIYHQSFISPQNYSVELILEQVRTMLHLSMFTIVLCDSYAFPIFCHPDSKKSNL